MNLDIYQEYLDKHKDICYTVCNCTKVEVPHMTVDYSGLWKLLIDRKMNKSQLKDAAHISTNAVAKLGKGESVSLETLQKICTALGCQIEDILKFVEEKQ